jgi:hypothetical protein
MPWLAWFSLGLVAISHQLGTESTLCMVRVLSNLVVPEKGKKLPLHFAKHPFSNRRDSIQIKQFQIPNSKM